MLKLANTYVLSERTAIGGAPMLGSYGISQFLYQETQNGDAIELIGHGVEHSFDLRPFEDRTSMDSLSNRLKQLDQLDARYSPEYNRAFDELNLLEARAYILLADAIAAGYVPDRVFGVRAIERFSQMPEQCEYLREHEAFRRQLAERLTARPDDVSIMAQVPSFLLQALHDARNWEGIFASLRDMRHSTAARHYRELIRHSRSVDPKERRESRTELARASRMAFEREGLSGSLNRWIVPTVGLSAAAVAFLFPPAAAIAGLTAAVIPTIESLRG